MARLPITDLGGTLNQGRAPSEIGLNEFAALSNFYQFGGKLRRRGGMRKLTNTAFASRITGLLPYRPEAAFLPPGGVDMVVAGLTTFGTLAGGAIAPLTPVGAFSITSNTRRWVLFQFKNIWYGLRAEAGLVRGDGSSVGVSGVDAPTTAPTLADGGAGMIPAANFVGVYTYYNSQTGLESNPSPVSAVLALGASRKITWSGITVSANPQVTSRRIYRSLPDQSGEYFLVAEIPDNVSTTYTTDDVLAEDLDTAVSQVNGTPPANLEIGDVWKERLFASDGVDLFHSEDGLVEAFDPDAVIPVFQDDGHTIRAVHAHGDRLIIGKTNKIHYLVGSDPESFVLLTLSDRHGCVSHHSMQSAEGHLFWLGSDNVYRSDGNTVTGIASVKLRTIIEAMDDSAARDAVATVLPQLGWYVLVIPGYTQLIYNYRTDVWTTISTAENVQAVGDFYDSNSAQELYVADDDGHVYRLHDTTYNYDDTPSATGGAITASFDSRALGAEAATKHFVERVSLLCPQYHESVTLSIISEGTSIKSRTVSLDYVPRWKLYNLSTRHQAKSQSQVRLSYSGVSAIELEGLAIDVTPLGRPTSQAH